MLTEMEKKIVRELQTGLSLESRPFLAIAEKLGITEVQLIDKVKNFMDRGIIRRFGATLRHQDIGFVANAMVVWKVEPGRIVEIGQRLADFPEVTHCYNRKSLPDWPYTIFTMVHGRTEENCREIARRMSQAVGVSDYQVIFSSKELKKNSMEYFTED
jgi:DNA-binding Lrp family transcriptional regulator